jgi:hypothetical protein
MNRIGMQWRKAALIGALLCVYLFSSLAFLLHSPADLGSGPWNGYYRLLVPSSHAHAGIASSLERAGFEGAVSHTNVEVAISNFSGVERIPLGRIDERLAPMDPRRDPFIEELPGIFTAGRNGEYRVYYLPAEKRLGSTRRAVASAVPDVEGWMLAESASTARLVLLAAFAAIVVAMVAASKRTRIAAAAGALPWLGTVATAGAGTFIAASAVYAFWVMFADAGRRYLEHRLQYGEWESGRRELQYNLLVLGGVWALALGFFPDPGLDALVPILISSAGLAAWTALTVAVSAERRRRQDHRLFVPVYMRSVSPALQTAVRYAHITPWVALIIIGAPYLAGLAPGSNVPTVPRPAPLTGFAEVDFASLQALDEASDSGLINIADYVAHIAYQEGFVYGASYGLPEPGDALYLSQFREENGTAVRDRREVLRYDEPWLESRLSAARSAADGVGALLLNGNQPSGVVRSSEAGVYSPGTHPTRYSLQALLAFSPFLILSIRVFLSGRSGAPIPVLRRKRQAA